MNRSNLLQCINVMADCFKAVAETPEHDQLIRVFILARDRAYQELIKEEVEK